MKYAVIIPDGAADFPLEALGGRTPFEAARTPNLDALVRLSGRPGPGPGCRLGTAATTPPGFAAGSDVCSMSLLGYDPARYHTGRAPLEAAALGLSLSPTDWIFRVNFVTVSDGGSESPERALMLDHSAGAISSAEARTLAVALLGAWRAAEPDLGRALALTHGVSYRNILVDSSGGSASPEREYINVLTTPPHEIPSQPWRHHRPRPLVRSDSAQRAADALNRLIDISAEVLPKHPINAARVARGQRPANLAWIWGQGTRPSMPAFAEPPPVRYGLRGCMTTAVDLLAGIASLIGWERLDVPGATSYHDNDYAGQGRAAVDALDRFDIVCCHVEAPDEASHQGDAATKVAAIEAIDRLVVGPLAERLDRFGDPEVDAAAPGWRLLFLPDHYTLIDTRRHDATPVPFLIAGSWVRSIVENERFTETAAGASDLCVDPGHDLMEYFLRGGLAGVPIR